MIKVLNVISDTNIGGAGKCVINYAKNYSKDKYDLKVVLPKDSALKKELLSVGVSIIEIDGMKDKSIDILAIPKLIKIFKTEKPDIIHVHASFSARIAAKLSVKSKIVLGRHCVFPLSKIYENKIVRDLSGKLNHSMGDRVIAVADITKDMLIKQGYNEDKIDVLVNGVDSLNKYSEEKIVTIKRKYGIKREERVIGMLARIEEYKGHKHFIEAAWLFNKQCAVGYKFVIAGCGNYEKQARELVEKLGIQDIVIFTGFIENVEEILNIFDLQVNASYVSETTSLSLLEGMSLGLPAVVTDCGGNSLVISDGINGYVVEKEKSEEIMIAIKKYFDNNFKNKTMQKDCLKIYNEKFNSKIYAKNVEKTYEKVMR